MNGGSALRPALVIFDKAFPYSEFTEIFLSEEVAHASANFSQIVFCHAGAETPSEHPSVSNLGIPVNAVSLKLPAKRRDVVRGALRSPTLKHLPKHLLIEWLARRSRMSGTPAITLLWRLLKLHYRAGKAVRFLDERLGAIPRVYYGYWFAEPAYLAAIVSTVRPGLAVTRAHAFDVYHHLYGYSCYHESSIPLLDAVYAISRDAQEYLQEDLGAHSGKILLSRLGTRDGGIQNIDRGDTFRLLTCSSIDPRKRLHLIVDALSLIRGVNVSWTHIGSGNQAVSDDLHTAVKQKIASPAITCEFLGFLPNAAILDFYRSNRVDLFANVSGSEGIPVSIMEAMSFGIPVAATDVGAVAEIVTHGENGFLMNPDRVPSELSALIKYLAMADPDDIGRLRSGARSQWAEDFNARNNYGEFYDFLWAAHSSGTDDCSNKGPVPQA